MTTLLRCRHITKAFGEHEVLKDVNFDIGKHEKIGLVGLNGAGKSTIANILTGVLPPDKGQIEFFQHHVTIGYVKQDATFKLFQKQQAIDITAKDKRYYWQIASHLGVDNWHGERLEVLSGGEKTKLALSFAIATMPDLLILDEPTNHLDFKGVEWLISELKAMEIAIIIISHDRYFLDKTVSSIHEIEEGKLTFYKGNYTEYRHEKKRRYESQLHQYKEQKKVEAHIEQEITRLKEWSAKAHREAGKVGKMTEMRTGVKEFHRKKAKMMDRQVKSKIKKLEKIEIEGVKKPKEEQSVFFEWSQSEKKGKSVILAENIEKSFDDKPLFQTSSFYIQRGEKVGIIGPNGCGKTTLLKMITGEMNPDAGHLWTSPTIKWSKLEQDAKDLNGTSTVSEWISELTVSKEQFSYAITVLTNMGFNQALLRKSIQALSHGEKIRLRFAQLIMEPQHIIVLDEPTNHLDLIYREQLEQALTEYVGTVIVVSHDRYFLESICHKLLVFEDGVIKRKEFGFKDYMNGIDKKNLKKTEKTANSTIHLDELLVIENELSYIIGELAQYEPSSEQYISLDKRFKELANRKRLIKGK